MISEVRPDITSEANDPVKNLRYKELSNDYIPICYAIADGEYDKAKKLIIEFLAKFSD